MTAYPPEWDELPKSERKKKLKHLKRERARKAKALKKVRNLALTIIILVAIVAGYKKLTQKTPQEIAFEQQVDSISLDGKVEEFTIEGRSHVPAGASVSYQTNPPTSGDHLAQAQGWGVYTREIDDKAAIHGLEHGGIWISYKDIGADEIEMLKEIGRQNSQSVIVSPRPDNDDKIVVASWGRMMRLDTANQAMIQKYIDTYKNQSPEKLAL